MYLAISAAGHLPQRRRRHTFRAINHGLHSQYELPTPTRRSAIASTASRSIPSRPDVLFMQKHWDVLRSDDAGESWREVSGNLPSDFASRSRCTRHEPETVYVVPILSDLCTTAGGEAARLPQPARRRGMGAADPLACRRPTATSTCCAGR